MPRSNASRNAGWVQAYTDGSCSVEGKGGWGVVLIFGRHIRVLNGSAEETTNNQMEMYAVIQALEVCKPGNKIAVYTDSQYVQKGITEYIKVWRKNGWKTRTGKPVKNKELWVRMDKAIAEHSQVSINWVPGHAGVKWNHKADELAAMGFKGEIVDQRGKV